MSVIIKPDTMKYRDPTTGEYKGVDVIAERTTTEQIAEIEAKADAAMSLIPDLQTFTNLSNDFAPQYAAGSGHSYAVGDYVMHEYKLYRCKNAISDPAEAFTASHWNLVSAAGEITNVKQELNYNAYNMLSNMLCNSGTSGGLTYTWTDNICKVSAGTSTAASANVLLFKTRLPEEVIGNYIYAHYTTTDKNVRMRVMFMDSSDGFIQPYEYLDSDRIIMVPSNAVNWTASIFVSSGVTLPSDVYVSNITVINTKTNFQISQNTDGMYRELNSFDMFHDLIKYTDETYQGITYTWNNDTCTVSGAATANSRNNIIGLSRLPKEVVPGSKWIVKVTTSNPDVRLRIIWYNDAEIVTTYYFPTSRTTTVPEGATRWVVGLFISSGVSLTTPAVVTGIHFLNAESNEVLDEKIENAMNTKGILSDGTDLDDVVVNGAYIIQSGYNYTHSPVPSSHGATLQVFRNTVNDNGITQIAIDHEKFYFRTSTLGVFNNWVLLTEPDENAFKTGGVLPNNTDLDTVKENRVYTLQSGYSYTNSPIPSTSGGALRVYRATAGDSVVLQMVTTSSGLFFMRTSVLGVFGDWISIGGFDTRGAIPDGTDLDDVQDNGSYVIQSGYNYINSPIPSTHGAEMLVFKASANTILQLAYDSSGSGTLYIRAAVLGVFRDWDDMSGETITNNYYNTYQTDNYENTYNITCTPTITTDTNNYLASTGDTTDRTGDIQTMLNTTGVCHLGPGPFYTTGIEIPNWGTLIGSGKSTRLVLNSAVTSGYAVRLKTYSTIKDIYLQGGTTDITPSSTVGTRHGILFEGTADSESPQTYYLSYITGCLIRNFAGGGITCYNTGLSPLSSLVVSDVQIAKCDVGINISYFSEFHRMTNISCTQCYYGCINNGGNNNFVNCDFSGNKQALLIDNRTGQSRNNTHGTYSACTFHHSDNVYVDGQVVSAGVGIQILGAKFSERFVGCLIGYSKIEIDDAVGMQFANCYLGSMADITVTNSKLVTFDSCQFKDANSSPLIQSNNISLLFNNCYLRSTGEAWNPMS